MIAFSAFAFSFSLALATAARDLADDGEQDFAVAQLVEKRRVGAPVTAHVGPQTGPIASTASCPA